MLFAVGLPWRPPYKLKLCRAYGVGSGCLRAASVVGAANPPPQQILARSSGLPLANTFQELDVPLIVGLLEWLHPSCFQHEGKISRAIHTRPLPQLSTLGS